MHMIVGNGELPKKDLTATLGDLWEKAQEADEEFWFTIVAQDEPNATHKALTAWLAANEIYYEVIVEDADSVDEAYSGAQKVHAAKKTVTKVVNLLKASTEEDGADVLALFVNLEAEDDEDQIVLDSLQSAIDAGFKGYALNDSMTEIDLSEEEEQEEEQEEEEEDEKPAASKKAAPAKKAAAKKAAPAKKAAAKADAGPKAYTAEDFEDMTDAEIRAIGASLGVTTRGRDNWIAKILEAQGGGGDEEQEEEEETGGDDAPEVTTSGSSSSVTTVLLIDPETGTIVIKPATEEIIDAILGAD